MTPTRWSPIPSSASLTFAHPSKILGSKSFLTVIYAWLYRCLYFLNSSDCYFEENKIVYIVSLYIVLLQQADQVRSLRTKNSLPVLRILITGRSYFRTFLETLLHWLLGKISTNFYKKRLQFSTNSQLLNASDIGAKKYFCIERLTNVCTNQNTRDSRVKNPVSNVSYLWIMRD